MATPDTGGIFSLLGATGINALDGLLAGRRWGTGAASTQISYSFPDHGSYWSTDRVDGYGNSFGPGEPWNNFRPLRPAEQQSVRDILAGFEEILNVDFVEVADGQSVVGDLRFGYSGAVSASSAAHAYYPSGSYNPRTLIGDASPVSGDVWINSDDYFSFDVTPGSYDYLTLIHEIGHAIGLKHPHEAEEEFPVLDTDNDSIDLTVMSYNAIPGDPDSTISFNPTTLMALDIDALQHMYGANRQTRSGNSRYTYRQGGQYNETLWDGGGKDTLIYQASSAGAVIDLVPGSWQSLGQPLDYFAGSPGYSDKTYRQTVMIPSGVRIENAKGGNGDDSITGNGVANLLLGRGGDDQINGLAGKDTLIGGRGSDELRGGNGADRFRWTSLPELGDTVSDFKRRQKDKLQFVGRRFGGLGKGPLASDRFVSNSSGLAQTDTQRFVFNTSEKALYYDPDGSGSKAAVRVAILRGVKQLKASDIVIV